MHGGFAFIQPAGVWLVPVAALVGAAIAGWLIYRLLRFIAARITRHRKQSVLAIVARNLRAPAAWGLPFLCLLPILGFLPVAHRVSAAVFHAVAIILIGFAAWIVIRLVDATGDVLAARYSVDVSDNLHARKIATQFKVLRGIGAALIMLIALGLMLLTFPGIRALGAAVFASAGAAGIILGLAARPVLTNLLAGIQIALAQPIRLEDSVVVEGEWGWIEEITMTYVVVRIWDLRRLILPLSYFIEKPFTNWTRTSANLLGTAFIYADYTVPIQTVREELGRILKEDPLFDGFAWSLDVTNLTERVVEMRAMVSARSAGDTVNLRRHVREKLVTFLQKNYPECLPRTRVSLDTGMHGREPGSAPHDQAEGAAGSESSVDDSRT